MKQVRTWPFIVILIFCTFMVSALVIYTYQTTKENLMKEIVRAVLPVSPEPKQPLRYGAWYPWWGEDKALSSLMTAKDYLSSISPVWYTLTPSGELQKRDIKTQSDVMQIANSSGLTLIPTIDNQFDVRRVVKLISSKTAVDKFIQDISSEAAQYDYDGFDLDWEEVNEEYAKELMDFISLLSTALHSKNLTLSVTVHARTGEDSDWTMAKTYDWKMLSKTVDEVRIMAYDFHNEGTKPGPITPRSKLRKVVEYANRTIIGSKITIGLPNYGYDWSGDDNKSVSFTTASELINNNQGVWARDEESEELIGTYTDQENNHTIWIVDQFGLLQKISLAQSNTITSFCFWRIGEEDPTIWSNLQE
jgi:spore germination protein YaaH